MIIGLKIIPKKISKKNAAKIITKFKNKLIVEKKRGIYCKTRLKKNLR